MVSAPAPSRTSVCKMRSLYGEAEKICRMPRRSPSPSSPTFPIKSTGIEGFTTAVRMAEAIASKAVEPGAVVGNSGTIKAAALLLDIERSSCGKNCIQMGAHSDAGFVTAPWKARMFPPDHGGHSPIPDHGIARATTLPAHSRQTVERLPATGPFATRQTQPHGCAAKTMLSYRRQAGNPGNLLWERD